MLESAGIGESKTRTLRICWGPGYPKTNSKDEDLEISGLNGSCWNLLESGNPKFEHLEILGGWVIQKQIPKRKIEISGLNESCWNRGIQDSNTYKFLGAGLSKNKFQR